MMDLPEKNFLIFDADCGICQNSMGKFKKLLGDKIGYLANQDFRNNSYGIDAASLDASIKFFEYTQKRTLKSPHEKHYPRRYDFCDEFEAARIYHGAYAIYKALAYSPYLAWLLFLYEFLPGFAQISEGIYAVVSRNRLKISAALGMNQCRIEP